MNKSGPIVIIEDDDDDQDILKEIFLKLGYKNETCFFKSGHEALSFIKIPGTNPFLILSDINMPIISGFDLRHKIVSDQSLHSKCIPYVFFTTGGTRETVARAYDLYVQGFFIKPPTMKEMETTIKTIVDYWKASVTPGNYN